MSACRWCSPVHPRGRGEHQPVDRAPVAAVRFIPAGAGNTLGKAKKSLQGPVHPRGRGEHPKSGQAPPLETGSSPRARGTRGRVRACARRRRFIPAGAGNTGRALCSDRELPVHPRGRGEHFDIPGGTVTVYGSSPRARGTPFGHRAEPGVDRFIPAGAGNTLLALVRSILGGVHPRGRGEHEGEVDVSPAGGGSSPRARGTP